MDNFISGHPGKSSMLGLGAAFENDIDDIMKEFWSPVNLFR